MTFQTFVDKISPKNSSQVSVSGEEIRSTIATKSDIVYKSFLTGSYIRHTKIHPIDDLDIFFQIDFSNTQIVHVSSGILLRISGDPKKHPLRDYSVESLGYYYVSPIKLINHMGKIVKESYTTTNEQNRNGECYTVYLSSKSLTIDCVPCAGVNGQEHYLIPSGGNNLYWKKTNPAVDKEKIDALDKSYDGKLKGVIKIMKYWNKNKNSGVKFKSYILECLVYYAFKEKCNTQMAYLDLLKNTVSYITANVRYLRYIFDLPAYENMTYQLDSAQITRIVSKLDELASSLSIGEYTTLAYLEE